MHLFACACIWFSYTVVFHPIGVHRNLGLGPLLAADVYVFIPFFKTEQNVRTEDQCPLEGLSGLSFHFRLHLIYYLKL